MKRFLTTCAIFLVPPCVIVGIPAVFLFIAGEYAPVGKVIALQKNQEVLFGEGYSGDIQEYKMAALAQNSPSIAIIGTSRVMQFRSTFFNDSFYNAGGSVRYPASDLPKITRIMNNKPPSVILLGIDQNFLDSNFNDKELISAPPGFQQALGIFFGYTWKRFYTNYFQKKFTIKEILRRDGPVTHIGMAAIARESGFRNDGSYSYGTYLTDRTERALSDSIIEDSVLRIQSSASNFEFGTSTNEGSLTSINRFLLWAKQSNIHVVGFAPPYAVAIHKAADRRADLKSLEGRNIETLSGVFASAGFRFFDFSDPRALGAGEDEMINDKHFSEKFYARAVDAIAKADPLFRAAVNINAVRARIANPSPF